VSFGLIVSIVLHASLLGFALISVAQTPPLEPKEPVQAIIADVISESELNRMRKGVREAKLDEAEAKDVKKPDEAQKDVPKPRPVAAQPPPPAAAEPPPPEPAKPVEVAKAEPAPPPPAPPEPKVEPPKAEPDKAALDQKLEELAMQQVEEDKRKAEEERRKAEDAAKAKAAAEAEAKRKAEEKKKLEEKRRQELALKKKREEEKRKRDEAERIAKEKNKLDTDRLSELLNKAPDPKQAAPAAPTPAKPTQAKGPVKGAPEGRDQINAATRNGILAKLIWDTYSQNWDISCGSDGVDQVVVRVAIVLRPDGRLAQPPRVVSPMPGALFQLMADAALRAVVRADPVSFPPDLYKDGWDNFTAVFDARQRCGRG
jgi:colicin import membrane protein